MHTIAGRSFCIGGVVVLVVAVFFQSTYNGFSVGANAVCDFQYTILKADGTSFWVSHSDPYYNLNSPQSWLAMSLLIFVIARIFEKGLIANGIATIAIAIAVLNTFDIESIRNLHLNDERPYLRPITDLATAWMILKWSVIALAVAQIAALIYEVVIRIRKKPAMV